MPATARRPATYEDLLAVPEHLVAEILGGDLVVSPRPGTPHAYTAGKIFRDLNSRFDGAGCGDGGGWWILFEPELHLGRDIPVPNIAGWRHQRMPTFPNAAYVELAPDWVCEVASPCTRIDRAVKLAIYARARVDHVWLVDALARTLEVFRLENGRGIVAAVYSGNEVVSAEPFETMEIDLARWWPPVDAPR